MKSVPVMSREPLHFGETVTWPSEAPGEERTIHIRCPRGYDASTRAYPVLYLLDGDETLFQSACGVVAHAAGWEAKIPEMIVVGIGNVDRSFDMTPTTITLPDGRTHGGGGDAFLRFIEEELVPWVDGNFRTLAYRALSGTSASGLATVYALLSQKLGFSGYLASSPTLDWDDRLLFRRLEQLKEEGQAIPATFHLFCGSEDMGSIEADCRAFDGLLDSIALTDLTWSFRVYEGEGHCPFDGFRHGLIALFDGWLPSSGTTAQGTEAIEAHLAKAAEHFGSAFSLSPSAYCQLSEQLMDAGHAEAACELMAAGVGSHPVSEDVAFYYALSLLQARQREEARDVLSEAVARIPSSRRLGVLYRRLADSS